MAREVELHHIVRAPHRAPRMGGTPLPKARLGAGLLRAAAPVALIAAGMTPSTAIAQSASAATGSGTIEEIVVTAQKERSTLQKTAAAITALSGDALLATGVTDIRAAQAYVPSVRFQQQGAATEVYIRGVGSSIDSPQYEPPTSVHFNGVYVPRNATGGAFYDLERVEVLPGPQGTLYGRSTLGGTVQIIAKRPTRDFGSESLVEGGNYSFAHVSTAVNVPVSETLAVRGAFDYQYHKGYQSSGADSANNYSARLSALYKPSDDLSAYVWASVTDLNGHPANFISIGVDPAGAVTPGKFLNSNPWDDRFPASLLPLLPTGQVKPGEWRYKNIMVGGELNWNLSDSVVLTYIPSYLTFYSEPRFYFGGILAAATEKDKQTTHELRLSGDNGRLKWVAGLYGYRLVSSGTVFVGGFSAAEGAFPTSNVTRHRAKGLALFGQATYRLSDQLRLIAGGRYSHDDRVGNGFYFDATGLAFYDYGRKFNHGDFKVGVEYDAAPEVMLYATVQSGFQPGTFNQFRSTAAVPNDIKSAKLIAYTGGFKSRAFGDTLQINNEAFFYNYENLFVSAYDALTNSTRTFNAQRAHIYGDQLDVIFKPTRSDQFTLTVGYLHARYKKFILPGGASYSGSQIQYSPDWTISAGYFHDFDLPKGYVRAQVNTRFEDSFFGDYLHSPGTRQGSYTKTDASLTYYDDDGRWSFGIWAKNLEKEAVEAAVATGSLTPFNPLAGTGSLEPPRTYGVRATFKM
ncbi:TonB-dependent receptor [Rhizorhabdus histidinilytica]|uniref:TonB-dependent receptor n=1 Tax=Rhizorhabdus histidinilytica TaxID=439228 RepID=UPI001592A542|nr:TonB-dependent receptor [Rhizorhabdus histidinilytica]